MLPSDPTIPLPAWTEAAWSAVLSHTTHQNDISRGSIGLQQVTGLARLYRPLTIARAEDRILAIGQLGQSLDGRIATQSGHSHYINGPAALTHLHALRALVQGVAIGVGTALADDPQLTVRRLRGPNPARIVIDPRGRLPADARCWRDDGTRRILVHGGAANPPEGVESLAVPAHAGRLDPNAIREGLARIGLRRLLIEGGAATLSAFLQADALDRLHLLIGPSIIGSGKPGLQLEEIATLDQALRPSVLATPLPGGDYLFDCALHRHRPET
ncbi:MAG: RibD family protein [Rhodospirillales bacterium]|nr:RibD family protein [Rhodospirillales bacterium]